MSLTSYRAAPPRVERCGRLTGEEERDEGSDGLRRSRDEIILFVDLATTYSPAP
jgi:hypothetical protein